VGVRHFAGGSWEWVLGALGCRRSVSRGCQERTGKFWTLKKRKDLCYISQEHIPRYASPGLSMLFLLFFPLPITLLFMDDDGISACGRTGGRAHCAHHFSDDLEDSGMADVVVEKWIRPSRPCACPLEPNPVFAYRRETPTHDGPTP